MVTTVSHSNTVAFPVEKTSNGRRRIVNADDYTDLRLHLSSVLQTSLDLSQVLSLFFEQTRHRLHLNSLVYRYDKLPDAVKLGQPGRHSAEYRLITSQDALGEITFTRRKAFSEDELQLLELLIGCLICPLRNALMYREAVQNALRDPLTGVGNRLALENSLEREIAIAQRHGHDLSLLVIDIDHFKEVNDRYGHTAGDCVLKQVAAEVNRCCRDSDATFHSYRFGGEEFVVLLNFTDNNGARVAAERIRGAVEAMASVFDGDTIRVTTSIGIASLGEGDGMGSLFERADNALYKAKHEGRNRVVTIPAEVRHKGENVSR